MAELATTPPTLDGDYPLTQDQIDSFRENGFVYLPNLCSPDEVAYFREAIARVTYAAQRRDGARSSNAMRSANSRCRPCRSATTTPR